MNKLIFGGIIAVILLVMYGFAIYKVVSVSECMNHSDCKETVSESVKQILNVVGGLVAALVISILAATEPGGNIGRSFAEANLANTTLVNIISTIYIVIWMLAGLVIWIEVLRLETIDESLKTAAEAWLGLAVAAAYSYFGIKPQPSSRGGQ